MKQHIVRLMPGEDMIQGIEEFCFKHNIKAGYLAVAVGSLSRVSFRKGHSKTKLILKGPFEIVSIEGIVSKGGHHIHMAVSDESFNVRGGHVISGCIVHTGVELIIVELENYELNRSKDLATGYKTMFVKDIAKACCE